MTNFASVPIHLYADEILQYLLPGLDALGASTQESEDAAAAVTRTLVVLADLREFLSMTGHGMVGRPHFGADQDDHGHVCVDVSFNITI